MSRVRDSLLIATRAWSVLETHGVSSVPLRWHASLAARSAGALAEPAFAEPTLAEPTFAEPALAEPTLAEPALAEPALAASALPGCARECGSPFACAGALQPRGPTAASRARWARRALLR